MNIVIKLTLHTLMLCTIGTGLMQAAMRDDAATAPDPFANEGKGHKSSRELDQQRYARDQAEQDRNSYLFRDSGLTRQARNLQEQNNQMDAKLKIKPSLTLKTRIIDWFKRKFTSTYDNIAKQALNGNDDAFQELNSNIQSWRENGNTSNEAKIQALQATVMRQVSQEYQAIDRDQYLMPDIKASAQRILREKAATLVRLFNQSTNTVTVNASGDILVTSNTPHTIIYDHATGQRQQPSTTRQ